jgi:protein-L-isoaspartate(D-aspartate) O-methyltransferase
MTPVMLWERSTLRGLCMRRSISLMLALVAWVSLACSAASQSRSWGPVLRAYGVKDERVIRAMDHVRRADFLPLPIRSLEFEDRPLPIGYDQTTSQPSLIAMMVAALELKPGCSVLEVGTGSGYQTALLGELCQKVASIEIVPALARSAAARLRELGYKNVSVKAGDGYLGWPEEAPFDGIVVSASAPKVPAPLIAQLKPGGRMIIPIGDSAFGQLLLVIKQADGGYTSEKTLPVSFVPMTGDQAERDRRK